jgi:hypothetical protein
MAKVLHRKQRVDCVNVSRRALGNHRVSRREVTARVASSASSAPLLLLSVENSIAFRRQP